MLQKDFSHNESYFSIKTPSPDQTIIKNSSSKKEELPLTLFMHKPSINAEAIQLDKENHKNDLVSRIQRKVPSEASLKSVHPPNSVLPDRKNRGSMQVSKVDKLKLKIK